MTERKLHPTTRGGARRLTFLVLPTLNSRRQAWRFLLPLLMAIGPAGAWRSAAAEQKVDFAKQIKPIFEAHCIRCHGPKKHKGHLRMDTWEAALKGGEDGKVVVPEHPEKSDLYRRIGLTEDDDDVMPAKGPLLTKEQIRLVRDWISEGAPWPKGLVLSESGGRKKAAAPEESAGSSSAAGKAVNFAAEIAPILQQSCIHCHGPKKQKGKLRLDTQEVALKGGEDGKVIVPGHADKSDLYRRITLPESSDDVMPAKGDLLTKEQTELIKKWIDAGAPWPEGFVIKSGTRVARSKGKARPVPHGGKQTPGERKAIEEVEASGASIRPIASGFTLQQANFRGLGTNATDQTIAPLKSIPNLYDLNLSGTAVTDAGMANLEGLTNLSILHLEKTGITDAGLAHLSGLNRLTYLNLYGTRVSDAGLDALKGLTHLEHLYLWQSQVTEAGAKRLAKALPGLEINLGWKETTLAEEDAPRGGKK